MQHLRYEDCRRLEWTHTCAVCDRGLVTFWDYLEGAYAVACSDDHRHEGFKRSLGSREARQMGLPIPPWAELTFQREEDGQMQEQLPRTDQTLRALVPRSDAGNSKALAQEQCKLLVDYAEELGLNPYLKHVDIYFGQPRVTIYGWYYHAAKQPNYGYVSSRPLNVEERQDQMIEEHVHAWLAEVIGKDGSIIGAGFGYSQDKEEGQLMKGVSEDWATPQRRAEKRAEEDALGKAFPMGAHLPGEEGSPPETVNDRKDDPKD